MPAIDTVEQDTSKGKVITASARCGSTHSILLAGADRIAAHARAAIELAGRVGYSTPMRVSGSRNGFFFFFSED